MSCSGRKRKKQSRPQCGDPGSENTYQIRGHTIWQVWSITNQPPVVERCRTNSLNQVEKEWAAAALSKRMAELNDETWSHDRCYAELFEA